MSSANEEITMGILSGIKTALEEQNKTDAKLFEIQHEMLHVQTDMANAMIHIVNKLPDIQVEKIDLN